MKVGRLEPAVLFMICVLAQLLDRSPALAKRLSRYPQCHHASNFEPKGTGAGKCAVRFVAFVWFGLFVV